MYKVKIKGFADETYDENVDEIIYIIKTFARMEDVISIEKIKNTECITCGSKLGIDCGEAEPDYNDSFCSYGCFKKEETPLLD